MEASTRNEDLFGPEHVKAYQETGGERGFNWRTAPRSCCSPRRAARAASPAPIR